ncbi:MAG: SDR family oxidoreductase [Cyanobacteria bacterium P01_G01_bin.54]
MTQKFPTALITGASSGIGRALATCFAQNGYQLVLIARDVPKLNQVAGQLTQQYRVPVKVLPQNLARLGAANAIAGQLKEAQITIDILVNNAGFGGFGYFWQRETAQELAMIQVNAMALTHLTRLLLPEMIAQGQGRILNVASTAAFQPGPLMAVYYATKAYVLSFSEALANELQGTGVSLTVLCPGPTASGFQQAAQMEASRLVKARKLMDAQTVAQAGYAGLMRGQVVVVPGLRNQVLAFSIRFLPRPIVRSLVRRMQSTLE